MFKNIIWDFVGKLSVQLIGFAITILLARMISPAEFGVMGMAMAVVIIAHLFLDLGFNRAIIQRPEITELQYSTIFYLNVGIAVILTAVCYLLALPLSIFYKEPLIKPVFQTLSVAFLINGLNLVPSAILYKQLRFKLNSVLNIFSAIIGGIVGIAMAFKGYGIWSLVAQSIITSLSVLVTNFVCSKWLPIRAFSLSSIKPLWAYGSKMFASGLLDAVYTRLDIFIIGKIFSTSTLGFYTRAQSMDQLIRQLSVNSIMGAMFPYIAKYQNDRTLLSQLYQRYLHIICFISIALSGALFLTANFIFELLFTARWHYASELFQLMSIVGFAWPVSSLMCNIIAGVGNAKAFLRLEIYKKLLFLPVYLVGFVFSLKGFLYFFILASCVGVTVNAMFLGRELYITVFSQLKIITGYLLAAAIAVILTYLLSPLLVNQGNLVKITLLSLCFGTLYLITCYLLKLPALKNIPVLYTKIYSYFYDKCNKNLSASL